MLLAGALLAPALLLGAAHAQTLSPADSTAIQGVIADQIQAFRHDDGATAFSFATPALREMFVTPENFMDMVRSGYQPVYRPQRYAFEPSRTEDGAIEQPVDVIGPDGRAATAIYTMERDADGQWRIAGCRLVVKPAISS
jgi:hypothetical protein